MNLQTTVLLLLLASIVLASCSTSPSRPQSGLQESRGSSQISLASSPSTVNPRLQLLASSPIAIGTAGCQTTRRRIFQRGDDVLVELEKPHACVFQSIEMYLSGQIYFLAGTEGGIQKDSSGTYQWLGNSGFLVYRVHRQLSVSEAASVRLHEVGCQGDSCVTSFPERVVRQAPRLTCDELERASCKPNEAKNAATIMCRAVSEGCEKLSERFEKTTDRVLVRNYCAVHMGDLSARRDEVGKILYRYCFQEGNAVGRGVDDVGKAMMKDGGIISGIYGLMLRGIGGGLNAGINAGKGGNCPGEYEGACITAYQTWVVQCR